MRIWDVHPSTLCRSHLLGEHRELHGLWNILTQDKKGYSQHPETKRWIGKEGALYVRHETLVREIQSRGYKHGTPLDPSMVRGSAVQDTFVNTLEEQERLLRDKPCGCYPSPSESDMEQQSPTPR